jgi:formylglycine-generating enzyme required for sulfatase activity
MDSMTEALTGMEFVRIPAGKFLMGDTFGEGLENELPVHEVRLDAFYLGRFPVTQSQWVRLIPENPSHFRDDRLPVEQVTWLDIQNFVRRLSAADSRKVFRLPTEAEWEYAARSGGRRQRYAGGDDADAVAWYAENSGERTRPVGTKTPNDLGLFDMSGNVWEWCQDRFSESAYRRHKPDNPVLEAKGEDRVIRGGGWNMDAWSIRCARRMGFPQDTSGPALGFRLVMQPG